MEWGGPRAHASDTHRCVLTLSDCVAENGHADVVEALIKAGAALDATDNEGWTALIFAALSPRAMQSGAGLAPSADLVTGRSEQAHD